MKIAIAAGGTLGHVFPTFPIINLLKEKLDVKIIFFCDEKQYSYVKTNQNIDKIYVMHAIGFKRKFTFKNFKVAFRYLTSYYRSRKILKKEDVILAIGFGGYTSLPVIKAAINLNIKTMIHEQNSIYGLANLILKKKVDVVLNSYDIDENSKVVYNPRTSEYYRKYFHLLIDDKNYENTVLVVGGSLGSKRINDLVISLKEEFIKEKIQVTLITGKKYYQENYKKIKENDNFYLKILPFCNTLFQHIISSKVIVSRSGATTISEILALRKVALFIPSPNVTNDHQTKNALKISSDKMGIILEEKNMNGEIFMNQIKGLLYNESLRKEIITNIKKNIRVDSDELFFREILNIIGEK